MSPVKTQQKRRRTIAIVFAALLAWAVVTPTTPQPAFAQPVASFEFDIVGIELSVDPPTLTVPKNIPTLINTQLTVPGGGAADTQAALDRLRGETRVKAQLRGPAIPGL